MPFNIWLVLLIAIIALVLLNIVIILIMSARLKKRSGREERFDQTIASVKELQAKIKNTMQVFPGSPR